VADDIDDDDDDDEDDSVTHITTLFIACIPSTNFDSVFQNTRFNPFKPSDASWLHLMAILV